MRQVKWMVSQVTLIIISFMWARIQLIDSGLVLPLSSFSVLLSLALWPRDKSVTLIYSLICLIHILLWWVYLIIFKLFILSLFSSQWSSVSCPLSCLSLSPVEEKGRSFLIKVTTSACESSKHEITLHFLCAPRLRALCPISFWKTRKK